jgi:colanic acid/amylovoran biosynthesis protein
VRILVVNTVALNTGDAAILLGLLHRLRDAFGPDVELSVADSNPETARRLYPWIDFRPGLWRHVERGAGGRRRGRVARQASKLRLYAGAWCLGRGLERLPGLWLRPAERRGLADYGGADLMVSTGGTYLSARYWLKPRILELQLALLLRRPLVLFTQSLGPFRRRHRATVRRILGRAELVLLRDVRSLEHLRDLGVPEPRVRLSPDAAFGIAFPDPNGRPKRAQHSSRPRVAISVRELTYFTAGDRTSERRYRRSMAAAVEHLVRGAGAEVTFVSTCQGVPEYWTDDSTVAEEIVALLPEDVRRRVRVDRDFHTPGELTDLLRGFDVAIATRMHMAILALRAGVPVLGIAYEFKTRELFEELGLGEFVQDIEHVDAASLPLAIDTFLSAAPTLRRRFGPRVDEWRAQANGTGALIRAAVTGRPEGSPAGR